MKLLSSQSYTFVVWRLYDFGMRRYGVGAAPESSAILWLSGIATLNLLTVARLLERAFGVALSGWISAPGMLAVGAVILWLHYVRLLRTGRLEGFGPLASALQREHPLGVEVVFWGYCVGSPVLFLLVVG